MPSNNIDVMRLAVGVNQLAYLRMCKCKAAMDVASKRASKQDAAWFAEWLDAAIAFDAAAEQLYVVKPC